MASGNIETDYVVNLLRQGIDMAVRKIVLTATENLMRATPVDTGWARANWVPSIGIPGEEPAGFRKGGVGEARAAQQEGMAAVATSYSIEMGPVWIANNVPYIVYLNDGSSEQAPSAFVQSAIQRAVLQAGVQGVASVPG